MLQGWKEGSEGERREAEGGRKGGREGDEEGLLTNNE